MGNLNPAMATALRAARRRRPLDPFLPPVEAAKAAQLRHVTDARPGIRRRVAGTGFTYVGPDDETVRDEATLARIRSLAIPPAWTDVWICPQANGHLQASGRDARGRKQYRYHQRWRQVRDETKYGKMILFGTTLPRIRERVDADLALSGLPRERTLATVVGLLETTFMRVGNEEYAKANGSYGLTTLQNRHVRVEGTKIRFRFRGKSGKEHTIDVTDRRLARLVRKIRDLPGQDLFQYLDDAGDPQPITSGDVNDYLRAISDQDFTAKDFRTWSGTLLATRCLASYDGAETASAAKSAQVSAVASVAERLGNTVAVCRKCYVHPAVLDAFQAPEVLELWKRSAKGPTVDGLDDEENALLRFLTAVGL